MERQLDIKMEKIMKSPGVVGAIAVDKRGLCVSAKGVASPEFSGVISNLAEISRKFENSGQPGSTQQGKSSYPVVRLEADQGYCLIQKSGDTALGIFKKF